MARLGETDHIVGAAIWLASDASAYVTGANVPIDGGLALGLSEGLARPAPAGGSGPAPLLTADPKSACSGDAGGGSGGEGSEPLVGSRDPTRCRGAALPIRTPRRSHLGLTWCS